MKHFLMTALALLVIFNIAPTFAYPQNDYKGEVPQLIRIVVPKKRLRDGLYIGLGLGYDNYRIRQQGNIPLEPDLSVNFNPPLAAKGFLGSIFAGYGQYFRWFYIAGEIFAESTQAQTSFSMDSTSDNYHSTIQVSTSYGASILPGIRFSRTALVYARVGYVRTLFKTREHATIGGGFNVFDSNWSNGLNGGLGIETLVYRNFSVRLEYTYTNYSQFISQIGTSFSPANNQVVLGAIYHFDCIG